MVFVFKFVLDCLHMSDVTTNNFLPFMEGGGEGVLFGYSDFLH